MEVLTPNQLHLLSLLLGQVIPPLTDFVNKYVQSSKLRFFVSLGVSSVVGVALSANNLKFSNLDQILMSCLILWASGQTAYKTYYENSAMQHIIREKIMDKNITQPNDTVNPIDQSIK